MATVTEDTKKTSSSSEQQRRSSRIESELSTMFILDMMRQKKEKLMRLKKDELINEMAKKQRERMAKERETGFVCDGTGFRGVQYYEGAGREQSWRKKV